MGTVEIVPTAVFQESGSRTLVGAASVLEAISNPSTSSYVRAAGSGAQTWNAFALFEDPRPMIPHGAAIERVQLNLIHSHWSRNPNAYGSEIIAPLAVLVGRPLGGANHRFMAMTTGETFSGFSSSTSPVTRTQPHKTKSWEGKFFLGFALQESLGRQFYCALTVLRGQKPYYGPNLARLYYVSLLVHYNERPTVTLHEPSGTVVVARPKFEWTFSDPEGSPAQQVFDARIYRKSVADHPEFNIEDELRFRPVYRRVIHTPNNFHQIDDRPIRTQARAGKLPIDIGKGGFGKSGEQFAAFVRAKNWDIWAPPSILKIPGASPDPVGKSTQLYAPYSPWARQDFTLSFASPTVPEVSATYDADMHAIAVAVEGNDNILPWQASSFESSVSDWVTLANTTIALEASQSFHGANSMRVTRTTSTGNAQVASPLVEVTPGQLYSGVARFRANTTGRNCRVGILWADESGTLVGSTTAADEHSLTDVNSGWRLSSVAAVAPGNARLARIIITIESAASGEAHFVDTAGIFRRRRTTLLTDAMASFESGTTGWIAASGTVLAQSADQTHLGDNSLRFTRTGSSGNAQVQTGQGTNGFNVKPNTDYTIGCYLYSDIARGVQLGIDWYDSGGSSLGTATFGSTVNENPGEWTPVTRTVTSPASAAYGRIIVRVNNVAVNEFHYLDSVGVWPGTATGSAHGWEQGGFVHDDPEDRVMELQRSLDGGETWEVIHPDETVSDLANQTLDFADYEVPSTTTAMYRARVEARNQDDEMMNSPWTNPVSVTMPAFTSWYLRDPGTSPPRTMKLHVSDASMVTPKPNSTDYPVGGTAAVMTHDGVKEDDIQCTIMLLSQEAYDEFRAMVDSGRVLLLQDTFGRQWWVQPDSGTEYNVLRSVKLQGEPFVTRHAHRVEINFVSVERPHRQVLSA